jgi:hypothetical protein
LSGECFLQNMPCSVDRFDFPAVSQSEGDTPLASGGAAPETVFNFFLLELDHAEARIWP